MTPKPSWKRTSKTTVRASGQRWGGDGPRGKAHSVSVSLRGCERETGPSPPFTKPSMRDGVAERAGRNLDGTGSIQLRRQT